MKAPFKAGAGQAVKLPAEELERKFATLLRPYGRVTVLTGPARIWYVIIPHAHEHAARTVAARLLTTFEDVMDARGGAEEQGLRPGVGISLLGADAASAEEMIRHATTAAHQVVRRRRDGAIEVCHSRRVMARTAG